MKFSENLCWKCIMIPTIGQRANVYGSVACLEHNVSYSRGCIISGAHWTNKVCHRWLNVSSLNLCLNELLSSHFAHTKYFNFTCEYVIPNFMDKNLLAYAHCFKFETHIFLLFAKFIPYPKIELHSLLFG